MYARRWYAQNNLEMYGVTPQAALRAYFLAAANIFEPNRATERLGWARTAVLAEAVSSHFRSKVCTDNMKEVLISKLDNLARFEQKYMVRFLLNSVKKTVT